MRDAAVGGRGGAGAFFFSSGKNLKTTYTSRPLAPGPQKARQSTLTCGLQPPPHTENPPPSEHAANSAYN